MIKAASQRWSENKQNTPPTSLQNTLSGALSMLLTSAGRMNGNYILAFPELLFVALFYPYWNWAESAAVVWEDMCPQ